MRNTDRLLRLINDILDLEKIESGSMEFDIRPHVLASLVQDTLSTCQAYAEQYGVRLSAEGMDAPFTVKVDRDRFIQVLTNLVSNACKFSPEDGVVEVSVQHASESGGMVKVSVQDQGQGIPAHLHHKIFQKFSQVDQSATRKKGGTGLGLSICKTIIEHMGGHIAFISAEGQGSTFFFELPLGRVEEVEQASEAKIT
jgi:signal transduction histidine kinase